MRKPTTRLVPWVGGKGQLMWAIQMLLPSHYKTLVDVFGGNGIITLNTAVPRGCLQIYNDLNHDLYNLLFCAKERPMELVREWAFSPSTPTMNSMYCSVSFGARTSPWNIWSSSWI